MFGLYCHSTEKSHNYLDNVGLTGNAANNNIDYVAVTCKNGRFDIGTVTHFDIYGVTCAMRIQPRITKIFGESEPCANTGADGRTDDLVGHLHTVHIGFQVRSSYTKMVIVCSNIVSPPIVLSRSQMRFFRLSCVSTKKLMVPCGHSIAFTEFRFMKTTTTIGLAF